MAKFIVLYRIPVGGLEAWMQVDEATRKPQEEALKAKWDVWAAEHASALIETAGAGKNTRITTAGAADAPNEVMLYSLVEAESQEKAVAMFKDHPHLDIPEASIDVMPANLLPGMN